MRPLSYNSCHCADESRSDFPTRGERWERCAEPSTALTIVLAATAVGAQESLPIPTVAAIKDATVLIATTDPGDPGSGMSGSGFLFRVDGQTGYIATNDHVISPPQGLFNNRPVIKVVLRSGTRGERTIPAEVVAKSSESDLAIVRIADVPDLPAPIDVAKETELVETMPVYVFGFPFGSGAGPGKGPADGRGRQGERVEHPAER